MNDRVGITFTSLRKYYVYGNTHINALMRNKAINYYGRTPYPVSRRHGGLRNHIYLAPSKSDTDPLDLELRELRGEKNM